MANLLKSLYNTLFRNSIRAMISFFVAYIAIAIIYIYATPFTKNITVFQRSMIGGKYVYNTISDDKGNLYVIANVGVILHFNAAQIAATIQEGGKYQITGYGYNIPALGIYPNILSAVKVSA